MSTHIDHNLVVIVDSHMSFASWRWPKTPNPHCVSKITQNYDINDGNWLITNEHPLDQPKEHDGK